MLSLSVLDALVEYGLARDEYNAAMGRAFDDTATFNTETLIVLAASDGANWLRHRAQFERERQ